ncbi:hypothetical protein NDK25_20745 [Niallia taxi]|nr:hypothetical protein [Niallia taxi]MDE5054647.1 hypothetical protein [Niallia taxi]
MKKVSYALLLAMVMLALAACGSDKEASKNSEEESSDEAVKVDKGFLNVEVTLPASFLEDEDIDSMAKDAEAEGIKVTKNDDGSLTYKMSKSKHKEMMEEMSKSMEDTLNELPTSGDYPSFKKVTHNDSFSEVTITVDQAAYEDSMDAFGLITVGFAGMYYQLYDGAAADNIKTTIKVIDESTNKEIDTIVYPDDMEDDGSDSESDTEGQTSY